MDKESKKVLRDKLKPATAQLQDLFLICMESRVQYHLLIAADNGAEQEDYAEIIQHAIDSGAAIIQDAMDRISERKAIEKFTNKGN